MEKQRALISRKRGRGRPPKLKVSCKDDIQIRPEPYPFPPAFIPKRTRTKTLRLGTKFRLDDGGCYFEGNFKLDDDHIGEPVKPLETSIVADKMVGSTSTYSSCSLSSSEEHVEYNIGHVGKQGSSTSSSSSLHKELVGSDVGYGEIQRLNTCSSFSSKEQLQSDINGCVEKEGTSSGVETLEYDDTWSSWFEDVDLPRLYEADILGPTPGLTSLCYDSSVLADFFSDVPLY